MAADTQQFAGFDLAGLDVAEHQRCDFGETVSLRCAHPRAFQLFMLTGARDEGQDMGLESGRDDLHY